MKFLSGLLALALLLVIGGVAYTPILNYINKETETTSTETEKVAEMNIPSTGGAEEPVQNNQPQPTNQERTNTAKTVVSNESTQIEEEPKEEKITSPSAEPTKAEENTASPEARVFNVGDTFYITDDYKWNFQGYLDENTFAISKRYNNESIDVSEVYYFTIDDIMTFKVPGADLTLKIVSTGTNSITFTKN